MARSLKKGPFRRCKLTEKVDAMNACRRQTGYQDLVTSFYNLPHSLDIQLLFMTEENMFRYMLQKIWLDINSESSLQPEHTEDTERREKIGFANINS